MIGEEESHRLLVDPQQWRRLKNLPDIPWLRKAAKSIDELAERWAKDRTIKLDETAHNWHLIRARHVQTRVVTLLVQYGRTGHRRFRDGAMAYLRDMGNWEYWSWITWRDRKPAPSAIFDLSYGENAMTLALAWDWLRAELTSGERAFLLDMARTRALIPYLKHTGTPGKEAWFYRKPDCNWNTVCNGGAGLLALALGDACSESKRVIELVEEGIRHYFEFMAEDGAWPEGIGYWGYGHRYGYYYLLSHERVTGKPHPLLEREGSRNTLRFPFLFSPNDVPAGFGDANAFFPLPFIYAAAQRYGMADVAAELDRRLRLLIREDPESLNESWPGMAELLLFHPGEEAPAATASTWPRVSVQRGLEWSYLADQWPEPRLYVSVRGGTTDAPHTHQDLTSLFVVVGREPLIVNIGADDYLDTTFNQRRFELYEMSAVSKNVLLVNGVGLPHPGAVKTVPIGGKGWKGVLLDGTQAAVLGTPVREYRRAVIMIGSAAVLVIDRVSIQHPGPAEARFHTYGKVRPGKTAVAIRGKQQSLRLAFAASVPATVRMGLGLPTMSSREPDHVIRWMTAGKHTDMTLATLMTPKGPGVVSVDTRSRRVLAKGRGFRVAVPYSF